ncbi:uncharacterized protein LOC131995386 [Stomoxys calcitrans]|uniref:uncharacterized protein LOC131995386 n=1 Tax=Stomoxys calcitrans TaxID=35570 RepID=UPI0027E25B3E|nr:uncharacterized protein LOC131995386 [Stomoxys calcitrans]
MAKYISLCLSIVVFNLESIAKTGITITRGSKGKPKLMLAGFAYFRNNVKGSKTYWLCAMNRSNRCKGRLITCSSSGELVIKNQAHNHDLFLLNYLAGNKIFESINYVKGQRGSRKMVCGGFSYICAKIKKGRKYWVCSKQRSRNCKARIITDLEEAEFYTRNLTHNHGEDNSLSKDSSYEFHQSFRSND